MLRKSNGPEYRPRASSHLPTICSLREGWSEIVGYLKCMERRLTTSNEANYEKLNESLLGKIVELSQMIKSLNERISRLEE
jgi:hypothetical protein